MTVISLFRVSKNTYDVFFEPSHAGNHIVEAKLTILDSDVEHYDIEISDSRQNAHYRAHSTIMSDEDYHTIYNW